MGRIRVLVCDDSALMRRSLTKIIESDPGLKVVGTARDGEDAVLKAKELKPDVITMDINMPCMDGITALQIITHEKIAPVIMVSSLTQEGATATFESLALGAFDYVSKPNGTVSAQMGLVTAELISKIKAATRRGTLKRLTRQTTTTRQSPFRSKTRRPVITGVHRNGRPSFQAVALGISTGGPKTLLEIMPLIPDDFPAAVFIVQHMPPTFTQSFAKRLDSYCALPCSEAEAGANIEPGHIYLARGGRHMTLFQKPSGAIVIRTPKTPEHQFIPSVDVMMESVLEVFGPQTIGVLMTGMGNDGAQAMVNIKRSGGKTIAESEESAIVFGMPREAIEMGGADIVVPAWEIVAQITKVVT